FFSSRRRHTRFSRDWSSDVCSSDLMVGEGHRREAVIPLERDNVIADSVGQAVFEAMMTAERFRRASGGEAAGGQQEVVLRIDGTTFARLILPHLVREGQRQGMDVAIRPAMGV